jgi:hypothetical protein
MIVSGHRKRLLRVFLAFARDFLRTVHVSFQKPPPASHQGRVPFSIPARRVTAAAIIVISDRYFVAKLQS